MNARFLGNPIERKRWLKNRVFQRAPLFLRSFLYLFHRYIIKLGFLDGKEGLIFHFLQGFWFRFLVDSTIFEIKQEMQYRPLEEVAKDKYDLDVNVFLNQETAIGLRMNRPYQDLQTFRMPDGFSGASRLDRAAVVDRGSALLPPLAPIPSTAGAVGCCASLGLPWGKGSSSGQPSVLNSHGR